MSTGPDRRYDLHDKIAWRDVAKEFGFRPLGESKHSWVSEDGGSVQRMAEEIVKLREKLIDLNAEHTIEFFDREHAETDLKSERAYSESLETRLSKYEAVQKR